MDKNYANRTLFHGDNLPILRGMNSDTVDLIATDPPFNKNKDFHATPDSLAAGARFEDRWAWDRDVHPDWVDAIQDDWPQAWFAIDNARMVAGEDMGAFRCWLGVRLMEMHRILKPTGSVYMHIDHTAHAYVKTLMDAIFGRANFRNEIVWCYTGPSAAKRYFPRKHDTLLFYVKSDAAPFNGDAVRRPYVAEYTPARGVHGANIGLDTAEKRAIHERGAIPTDWWADGFLTNLSAYRSELTGYPTQKPLALYERIIAASSNEGDMVLDPFCGCATTPVAAERLGRQWVGMDIWAGALGIIRKRMEDNRQLLADIPVVTYQTAPPVRTDGGNVAAPALTLKVQIPEPPGPRMSNADMKAVLIANNGILCAGCDRTFDDGRYLQLDHNTPRSQGGLNHISNRMLLCGPCNIAKSNTLTLEGLRRKNRENGWMAMA